MTVPKRKQGRPCKLTPARTAVIAKELKTGVSREGAAYLAHINPCTLIAWMNRGAREKSGKFFKLFQAVNEAESEAERSAVIQVRAMERGNAWFLARRFPTRWRDEARLELTGPNGGPIETKACPPLPAAEAETLLARLVKRMRETPEPTNGAATGGNGHGGNGSH